jgi:imidazolonepropionase
MATNPFLANPGTAPQWRHWRGGRVATMSPEPGQPAWGWLPEGELLTHGGHIAWVGPAAEAAGAVQALVPPAERGSVEPVDLRGLLVTPGLVDAHTHLVYGGHRAREFELRLQGATYEEIARAGGGIRSTVAATRAASDEALFDGAVARARALMAEGVTTLEVKSGYGLSFEHEARCLRVARRLGQALPVTVRTTSLAAHALPPEFDGRADDYIDAVCAWLPQWHAEGLVDAVDVFCERIAFSPAQTERVFQTAQRLGLPVKLHAEQLSDQGGAALAARYQALSCDHLEYLSDEGIGAMAAAGTVAMLLPGAYYFLRETRLPPVDRLRAAGVPIAIATDHNPGSSPTLSLPLMLNMACTLFRLTPEEALAGATRHAAQALGLGGSRGQLRAGWRADFALWAVDHPNELAYRFGDRPCRGVVVGAEPWKPA